MGLSSLSVSTAWLPTSRQHCEPHHLLLFSLLRDLTVVGHDEVHLRPLNGTLLEIRAQEPAAVPCQGSLGLLGERLILVLTLSGHKVQHGLEKGGQSLRNGPFLNDEAVEGIVIALPAVDDAGDGRPDGIVWRRMLPSEGVCGLVGVITGIDPSARVLDVSYTISTS